MDALLNRLANGEPLSDTELAEIGKQLTVRLQDALGSEVVVMQGPCVDTTGAFPGIFCKLRSPVCSQPFGYQWCSLMSLNGWDDDDGNWHINAGAHVFVFVNNQRVVADSGSLIRLTLQYTGGSWQWVSDGWVLDEFEEFGGITEPFY